MTRAAVIRARIKKRNKERGVALVMVLGAIAVLIVMLAEFQEDTSAELSSALAARDAVQAEYFARSAVNLSRLLIAAEPTIRQAIAPMFMLMGRKGGPPQIPVWEFSDRLLGAFNDEQGAQDFAGMSGLDLSLGKNLGIKGGRFEVVIVDEDSKINVNMGASNDIAHIRLAKQLISHFANPKYIGVFEQKDSQGNFHDRFQICSAIIDWADVDEQAFNCDLTQSTSAGSAVEDAWYQLLPKPYRRKNAPYDSLEELHMVRGVGDDFWAAFIDSDIDPNNPKLRNMTVWGQGAININTANALTLLALVCSGVGPQEPLCTDPNQMQLFVMGVKMAQAITMGAPLFGSPKDFVDMVQGQGPLGFIFSGGAQGGQGQGAQGSQAAGGLGGLGGLGAGLGLQKVKLLSPSDFAKGLTIESKIFSIYSVGVVKGYKRETRTSIHAVVDFRSAPMIGVQPGSPLSQGPGGQPPAPPNAGTGGQTVQVGNTDPNAIAAALQPNTGGQVVYYSIE
jgi:general secretion pathway protein K